MKMKLVRYCIAHALVIGAILILACGCADQTVNQSAVRGESAIDAGGKAKSFKVRRQELQIDGAFVDGALLDRSKQAAVITIDLEKNQVFWDQIPLKWAGAKVFLWEKKFDSGLILSSIIKIKGHSTVGNDAVAISENASRVIVKTDGNVFTRSIIASLQTPNGSYDEFFAYFNRLKFPENYFGLVASIKYVDGTPIGIDERFIASIQLVDKGCLLNEKVCHFYRSTLKNGNGVIVVNNDDSNLILWPDGNWVFYNLNNSGTRLSGADDSLEQVYSDLHKKTEEPASNNPAFTGTGFFITDDGYLISNYHVVKGAAKVRLLTGAGLIDATVVKVDAANDLALLKAAGKFAPLPVAASRTVKLGATVATVGFPDTGLQGFSPKLAKGEIGSLAGIQDDPRYFQISVPVQPGNSGGALVDAHGNVVGIVSAKLNAKAALDATGALPENVNYAVKSSLLLSFLESAPDVSAKLKEPNTKDEAFEDVVKSAQDAAVLVLVY